MDIGEPDTQSLHKKIKRERKNITLKITGSRPPILKSPSKKERINEKLVEVLEKLVKLMRKNRDFIRQTAYRRALETIQTIPYDITDLDELKNKKYIGPTIVEKFKEYLETGTLRLFEREKEKPGYEMSDIYEQFSQIYGVGPKKAEDLINAGVTSLDDLRVRQNELLNSSQKAGLKYYDDILARIPRAEIDEYAKLFDSSIRKLYETEYEIVGSYRRGAPNSGDIDMIITSPDPASFKEFIENMKTEGIILEILSFGATKCLVIARLPGQKARRVDFLYTNREEYPFAVLYFTGSKEFNTAMRGHALKWGFSMNEHGLSTKNPGEKKEEKVSARFSNERDIFDFLKLEYREPGERTGSSAVVPTEPLPLFTESQKKTMKKREPKVKSAQVLENGEPVVEIKKKRTYKKREPKVPPKMASKETENVLENEEPIVEIKKKRTYKKREPKVKTPSKEPDNEEPIVEIKKKRTYKKREPKIKSAQVLENGDPKKKRTYKKREPKAEIMEPVPIITFREPTQIRPRKLVLKRPNTEVIDINTTVDINKMDPKKIITEFKNNGISVLESSSETSIAKVLELTNAAYYNTKTVLLTDNEYDIIKEYMERKYPENTVLNRIGAPIVKNKIKLPFQMASMDKIKPDTNALAKWMAKYSGPYILSCKLDGVSGLYVWNAQENSAKLYTRGDGTVGQDITHLIKVLKLPKPVDQNLAVRGEFIIPKATFQQKYTESFANPRNLVSGIVNSKTIDEKAEDIDFIAYEVIEPTLIPSKQMELLIETGFSVVQYTMETNITNESLSARLTDWRTNYIYEIDGIIVTDDHIHMRKEGNPEYAFAFKMVMSDQLAEAKVVDVIWEASKSGYLKPRVRIEPIRLSGVTIEYATGFNGSFIESNKIGIGSIIQIIRSGDVIPHIKAVTVPAENAKMPNVPYHWTETHVDIIIDNIDEDETVREKNITAFFTTLEVDGLSGGNVKRIMKAGYNSVAKILKMNKGEFENVEGFKQKMIDKIYDGIHNKIKSASLLNIMVASNVLGRGLGERKIRPILDSYPDILTSSQTNEEKIANLRTIPGIGPENAGTFVSNIPAFLRFLKECDLESKLSNEFKNNKIENKFIVKHQNHALFGKHIVMTKVRDAIIIEKLKEIGATLDDNISKNTFVLIVKSKDDVSNKTKYATDHGITIMTPDEFKETYLSI